MKPLKIFYFTNIAPHYREEIWKQLEKEEEWDFHFVFGNNYAQSKIASIDTKENWISSRYTKVKNYSLGGVLFWQGGTLRLAANYKMDVAIVLGDMHILSNWLLSLILRAKGTKVFFWGHGFSGNEGHLKKCFRIMFNRLAHGHFLYGKRSKAIMQRIGFKEENLHVVNNSLSYSYQKEFRGIVEDGKAFTFFEDSSLPLLVFIGRLSPIKRLDILLESIHLLKNHNFVCNLLIIGDGIDREILERKVILDGSQGNVHFFGSSYNEKTNARLLGSADLCVSPGNIGLTAIHSMTYGTPCATHNDFALQMPEFEAIEEGVTGFFFEKDNASDLAIKIVHWFEKNGSKREVIRENCYRVVDNYYNPEFQMKKFKNVILGQ